MYVYNFTQRQLAKFDMIESFKADHLEYIEMYIHTAIKQ